MTKSILIYNAQLLDESMDTPGALLVVDGKIRSVFQGYFTTSETVEKMARAVMKEDGLDEKSPLDLYNARGLTLTPAFIDMQCICGKTVFDNHTYSLIWITSMARQTNEKIIEFLNKHFYGEGQNPIDN